MRYKILILLLLFLNACATIEPTAFEKEEKLKSSKWKVMTVSNQQYGGDEFTLMESTIILTYKDNDWKSTVPIDSVAKITRAPLGLSGLGGGLVGGIIGPIIGASISLTEPAKDEFDRAGKFIVYGLVGIPVGIITGLFIGLQYDKEDILELNGQTRSEKKEAIKKFIE